MAISERLMNFIRNLDQPLCEQKMSNYVESVTKRLGLLSMDDLMSLCREWAIGIDEVPLQIAALNAGLSRSCIERQIENEKSNEILESLF